VGQEGVTARNGTFLRDRVPIYASVTDGHFFSYREEGQHGVRQLALFAKLFYPLRQQSVTSFNTTELDMSRKSYVPAERLAHAYRDSTYGKLQIPHTSMDQPQPQTIVPAPGLPS
jgi:hypothetical protein